jgi:phosphinothricin acetyltransferase
MATPSIRVAALADLTAIDAIYNHYVAHATSTWQYTPLPAEERRAWFDAHGERHPITVADDGGSVVGWACLSVYNKRDGYYFTVENTIYVHPEHQRRGIGRALLADLIVRARAIGHRNIIAGVSGDQEPSLALHRAAGFVEVGRMKEIGVKFGKWLDVVYLQKVL